MVLSPPPHHYMLTKLTGLYPQTHYYVWWVYFICNENWCISVHAVQVTAAHLSPRATVDFCGCHPKVRSKRLKCVPVKLVWTQAHHLEDQQEVSACGHVHYLKCPLLCVEDVSEAPSSSLALPCLCVPSPATRGVWPWSRRAVGRGAQHSWCGCAAEGVPQGHARPSSDKGALHGLH